MGTRRSPRVGRAAGPQATFGLDDLIAPIKDDLPELMKAASAAAKAGNSSVLAALINLFAKHAERQGGDQAKEVMDRVLEMRRLALEKVTGENGSKGS